MSLSLYIHMPWCIRKCPYCDFNSHQKSGDLPENEYISALISDLETDLQDFDFHQTPVESIFIGGGTPSLISPESYQYLFERLQALIPWQTGIEITLEANPGTVDQKWFHSYRSLGINRLSLGIQSFNPRHLSQLGRIHDAKQAHQAIEAARFAGFDNINLDIMYGLPEQSSSEALSDLKEAMAYAPEHFSWYQLTIEQNTVFYKTPPSLPDENALERIEKEGFDVLSSNAYQRYEISAYSLGGNRSKHNLNYWMFGNYLGIGAGAHGKLSLNSGQMIRTRKHRQPKDYLNENKCFRVSAEILRIEDLIFEYMLNTTRLEQPISYEHFEASTGLKFSLIQEKLNLAACKGLISLGAKHWQVTRFGRRFTNDLQQIFLSEATA